MNDLRDKIAIEAMQQILHSYQNEGMYIGDGDVANRIATTSYILADEMLSVRNNTTNNKYQTGILGLSNVNFTIYVLNKLRQNNIKTLDELLSFTELELLKMDGIGRKHLNDIKEALASCNLSLAS